jgi:hypothetical protein
MEKILTVYCASKNQRLWQNILNKGFVRAYDKASSAQFPTSGRPVQQSKR